MAQITYKDAGVDLELYEQAMAKLPRLMERTHTARVMPLPGGFAGLFRLDANSALFQRNWKEPVLVSGTDGVGTKIKVAIAAKKYDTIGIDLVGMCVNDCLCLGAEPLFFLDYLALAKDDPELIGQLVSGVSDGCVETGMALIGGETAIMPDVYEVGDFDMAGFCVAVAEKERLIDGTKFTQPGDVLIGLSSTGFHSNGYSLVRKVVTDVAKLSYDTHVPELGGTVADALLAPTRLYVRCVLDVLQECQAQTEIRGLAHITGGGLPDNLPRILAPGCRARVDVTTWQPAPVFGWLQRLGNIDANEMFHVFNMGIGFVLAVTPNVVDRVLAQAARHNIPGQVIGQLVAGEPGVDLVNG